jgi:hypothetical protein
MDQKRREEDEEDEEKEENECKGLCVDWDAE